MAESEGDDSEEDKDVKRVTDIRSKMNAATDPAEKEKYKKQHAAVMSTFNRIPEEVELDEVLTKKTPAAEWIHDFVHSDNPKFEGKSKKKRTEMALAAYYSKQREKKS
jgi:hypothetical protein